MRKKLVKKKSRFNPKGQMNMSFGMIFAIIVGAFILFLAIYAVAKFSKTQGTYQDKTSSKTIGILTNPLESSFESSQTITMTTPSETRIYTGCSFKEPILIEGELQKNNKYFGRQLISTSQKEYGKWTEISEPVGFSNKYIFSENPSQGKTFYVFSKPFEFPYKVGDLIYVLSRDKDYCFIDADTIENGNLADEIKNLNLPMFFVEDEIDECPEGSTKVCFRNLQGSCDIRVGYGTYEGSYVRKGAEKFYFEGDALMFAAIFSDKETYECQINRTIQRAEALAEIYDGKYDLMIKEFECEPDLKLDLRILKNLLEGYQNPKELNIIGGAAYDLGFTNEISECKLW